MSNVVKNTTALDSLTLTAVYKKKRPLFPNFSLITDLSSPPQNPTKKPTKTKASSYSCCCTQNKNKSKILIKLRPSIFSASSTPGSHCFFNLFTKNKTSMDHYIVGTLIAVGFLFLFIFRRNDNRELKKDSTTYEAQNDVFRSSVDDGNNGSPTDVIIVGAGVAGAALAHTLGKVKLFSSLIYLGMQFHYYYCCFFFCFCGGWGGWGNNCLTDYIYFM